MLSTSITVPILEIKTANLGYPRIGNNRQLKKYVEEYFNNNTNNKTSLDNSSILIENTSSLRLNNINVQKQNNITYIPSNDFSLYDHVLDHIVMFDCIPKRYRLFENSLSEIDLYFAMARGLQTNSHEGKIDLKAMEMKKWFDTNYHYIVPEFDLDLNSNTNSNSSFKTNFKLKNNNDYRKIKPIREYLENLEKLNVKTRPVIIGPITFLMLGKINNCSTSNNNQLQKLELIEDIMVAYNQLFEKFQLLDIQDVQVDEPYLCLLDNFIDQDTNNSNVNSETTSYNMDYIKLVLNKVYIQNLSKFSKTRIHLTTYFSYLDNKMVDCLIQLINNDNKLNNNIESLHVDLCKNYPDQNLSYLVENIKAKTNIKLSLGIVNGRNIWKAEFENNVNMVTNIIDKIGIDRVIVSSSCSLQFVPHSLENESSNNLDGNEEVMSWLSFAKEKIEEISIIAKLVSVNYNKNSNREIVQNMENIMNQNKALFGSKRKSSKINNTTVQEKMNNITKQMLSRQSAFNMRKLKQQQNIKLPKKYVTTTIGSFPQTKEVRSYRNRFKNNKISAETYNDFLKQEIKKCIDIQEEIGLDLLVHGEFERNDMVEYFGENLNGYFITKNGWVQSYGTRCVKPPILYGDISRVYNKENNNETITVDWIKYAQSLTDKPVKGMLTGPVTCLQWSFVRDDQSREKTAFQLALAIRDEVCDLEKNGVKCIQVDEPAIREGLPLKKKEWKEYLNYAVNAFRLCSSGVRDETQIQTHMCYSDFNDIFESIKNMDADCLFIESSRSDLKLLNAFKHNNYENFIGLGLYDIHSPRIPTVQEMEHRLIHMLKYINSELVWINPDCGLKTRKWNEVIESLKNMIVVAKNMRKQDQQS